MTAKEFAGWKKRQHRNHELVDGVPVLVPRLSHRSDGDVGRFIENVRAAIPLAVNAVAEVGSFSLKLPDEGITIMVVPPNPGANFEFATAVTRAMFQGREAFLLVDLHEPRICIWRGAGFDRRGSEMVGLDARIDLPEIGANLRLADLYTGIDFEVA